MTGMTKTLTLTVVRHGETDANKERRLQGQIDTSLNELGIKQAKAAGDALKSVTFHRAYSSDLKRAKNTCEFILGENASSSITAHDIIEDKRIKERDFGEFENKLLSEYEAKAKEANVRLFDFTPESGEKRTDVRERAKNFFFDMIRECAQLEQEKPSVLLVSHGGLIRELFIVIFEELDCKLPSDANPGDHKKLSKNTSWSRFSVEVGAINAVDGEKPIIEAITCSMLCNADHIKDLAVVQ